MSKRKEMNWSQVENASSKAKRLHLEKECDDKFHCPVSTCEHQGFLSQRGCRKHVKLNHGWFYYFDEEPNIPDIVNDDLVSSVREQKSNIRPIPSFPTTSELGESFCKWLTGCGGGKSARDARQAVSRALKFLKFCCEDEDEVTFELLDFSISSPILIFKFADALQEEYNIGHSGRVGYLDSISELIDFRKVSGASDSVLRNVCITEVHLKKARKSVAKMMKLQWVHDLDIETLESKGHWATMEELLKVIPFHLPRYEQILQTCKADPTETVCALDLSFSTRFIAVYLFLQVKSSRPMTFQYLTIDMIENAKVNDGFVDQKQFKTAGKYGFDSLLFSESDIKVIDGYIKHIRPRLEPKCDYLLVTRNGKQYDKLSNLMTKMVYDAIGKYIHPSRYRQIVETESASSLSREEQPEAVSEDQKHSSTVARVYYQKQRSRDIAKKGQMCMKKLQGIKGEQVEQYIKSKLCEVEDSEADIPTPCKDEEIPLETCQPQINSDTIKNIDKIEQNEVDTAENQKPLKKTISKKLRFTNEEDEHLKKGLMYYGSGQWTAILKDGKLKFQTGRKPDSLKKRAESKFPKLCK